jgi:hypothetical protein
MNYEKIMFKGKKENSFLFIFKNLQKLSLCPSYSTKICVQKLVVEGCPADDVVTNDEINQRHKVETEESEVDESVLKLEINRSGTSCCL